MPQLLSSELRRLRDTFRRYVSSHQRPTIDCCRELTTKLSLMAEKADLLQQRAQDADDMEAVALDLDVAACAAVSTSIQSALKADQRRIQARLDTGDADLLPVSRSVGLAELSMPIGDSNVLSSPRAPRSPRHDCQGDGGDAA